MKYRQYVLESHLYDDLEELNGKILGCWCDPKPCHGHVLIELIQDKRMGLKTDRYLAVYNRILSMIKQLESRDRNSTDNPDVISEREVNEIASILDIEEMRGGNRRTSR